MTRLKKTPIAWEYSDIDVSNSKFRTSRRYSTIFIIFMKTVFDDDLLIEEYTKEITGLDYDVSIKFEKNNDGKQKELDTDDYTTVSFKTTYMNDFKYIVSFQNTIPSNKYYSFYQNQIRANAGHVLDEFFKYYVYSHEINGNRYVFPNTDLNDIDPLDNIGINFEDNPEYLNGGYDFYSPSVNENVISFSNQNNLYSQNISRYPGTTIDDGVDNEKIKNLISDWYGLYDFDMKSEDMETFLFNGIYNFYNDCMNHVRNVRFEINGIVIIPVEEKYYSWDYDAWIVRTHLEIISNEGITELKFHDFYLNTNGTLKYDFVYWWTTQNIAYKSEIIDVFNKNTDQNFKRMVEQNYVFNKLVSTRCIKFINMIRKKHIPVPEIYIDKMNSIFSFDLIDKNKKLKIIEVCASLITSLFNKTYSLYFDYMYPLCDFYLQYIVHENAHNSKFDYICLPFEYVIHNFTPNELYENYEKYCSKIEMSIQLLYSLKCSWEFDENHMLTDEMLKLCFLYRTDIITESFSDTGGVNHSVNSNIDYRVSMFVNIISKIMVIPNSELIPHNIFDILKLYAKYEYSRYYRYPTTAELTEAENNNTNINYCGRISSQNLSIQPINLVNVVNLLLNKMAKDPTNKDLYIITISIINKLIGGVFIMYPGGKYDEHIKILSFFLLCTDRYELEIIERLADFINKGNNIGYATVCGANFENTIKETIITKLIPMAWGNKLSIEVFDNIDPMIDHLGNFISKELLYDTKHNLTTYLDGV